MTYSILLELQIFIKNNIYKIQNCGRIVFLGFKNCVSIICKYIYTYVRISKGESNKSMQKKNNSRGYSEIMEIFLKSGDLFFCNKKTR